MTMVVRQAMCQGDRAAIVSRNCKVPEDKDITIKNCPLFKNKDFGQCSRLFTTRQGAVEYRTETLRHKYKKNSKANTILKGVRSLAKIGLWAGMGSVLLFRLGRQMTFNAV